METKLSIKQRILLIGILAPMESSHAKREIIKNAIKDLALSVEEIQATNYQETQIGQSMSFTYKTPFDPMKIIAFNSVILEMLAKAFKALDKEEKLNADTDPLFEIFVQA